MSTKTRPAGDGPVLEVLGLLWEVEHALRSRSKRMETFLGVTGPQRLVLRLVSRQRDMTPGDLARTIHLHPSTLTGILQRLVDRGLLERETDPQDHRRAHLRVTAAAAPVIRATRDTVEARIATVLSRLSTEAIDESRQVLKAIVEGLQDDSATRHSAAGASRRAPSIPSGGSRRRPVPSRRGSTRGRG